MACIEDLTGRRFGKLTVMEKTQQRREGYVVWKCLCDCGNEILVNSRHLKRGTVKSCGCEKKTTSRHGNIAEDLTGKVFADLTVLRRAENRKGRTCWLCRCICGNEKVVLAKDLKSGKVKSCGCRIHAPRNNREELAGRQFGRLTALYATDMRDKKGSVYWHCRCTCGNEVDVTEAHLVHGNYKSCGCLREENKKRISERSHRIDGTCVEILENRKYRRDNKSGFRGVSQMKNGKYRVDIGFKRKRYYIGTFDTFNEAVEMRLNAEHLIHDKFVEAYYEWKEKSDQDPEWGEKNALNFNIDWGKVLCHKR